MTMNKIVLALGTLLAACSGSAVPAAVSPAPAASACAGGRVHNDAELAQYAHCTAITGDLEVSGVSSMEALRHVRSVDGALIIRRTERLYSLTGLENLRRVETLRIEQNRGLISVGSLNALEHAVKVTIIGNPRLSKRNGLMEGLPRASAEITMADNLGLRAEGVAVGAQASVL